MVRLPVRCLAVAAYGSAEPHDGVVGRSLARGVCVVTDRSLLGRGDGVRLAFEVADGTPFKLEGHVAHAELLRDGMRRYGLEFAELDLATEQRMFKAVFEQEQASGPPCPRPHVGLGAGDLPARRRALDLPGPRAQLSADDVQVITRRSLSVGERIWSRGRRGPRVPDRRHADVAEVLRDHRGSHIATLAFDGLDRVTRSSILRRAMEQERRELAGE